MVRTESHLLEHGSRGQEGLVLWGGNVNDGLTRVTTAIHPPQRCSSASVDVLPGGLQAAYRILERDGARLVAQVHSHPGPAFHSGRDDAFPATFFVGFVSIVVPDFCRDGFVLNACSIWIHEGFGKWTPMTDANERFEIDESA